MIKPVTEQEYKNLSLKKYTQNEAAKDVMQFMCSKDDYAEIVIKNEAKPKSVNVYYCHIVKSLGLNDKVLVSVRKNRVFLIKKEKETVNA